jgi:hypothetical protein
VAVYALQNEVFFPIRAAGHKEGIIYVAGPELPDFGDPAGGVEALRGGAEIIGIAASCAPVFCH